MPHRPPAEPIGIVELGECCARFRALELDLFEALGSWVATTDDPALQRLFAEAAHRHAWHADLWRDRTPSIPPVDGDELTAAARTPIDADVDDGARARRYRDALSDAHERLDRLRNGLDPMLDPATDRTIALVAADLDELADRLETVLGGR